MYGPRRVKFTQREMWRRGSIVDPTLDYDDEDFVRKIEGQAAAKKRMKDQEEGRVEFALDGASISQFVNGRQPRYSPYEDVTHYSGLPVQQLEGAAQGWSESHPQQPDSMVGPDGLGNRVAQMREAFTNSLKDINELRPEGQEVKRRYPAGDAGPISGNRPGYAGPGNELREEYPEGPAAPRVLFAAAPLALGGRGGGAGGAGGAGRGGAGGAGRGGAGAGRGRGGGVGGGRGGAPAPAPAPGGRGAPAPAPPAPGGRGAPAPAPLAPLAPAPAPATASGFTPIDFSKVDFSVPFVPPPSVPSAPRGPKPMTREVLSQLSDAARSLAGSASASEAQSASLVNLAEQARTLSEELGRGPTEARRRQIVSAGKQLEALYDRALGPFVGAKSK